MKQGTIVGQDGLEHTYDRYLRGQRRRRSRMQVDAIGRPIANDAPARAPSRWPASSCKLSLDLDLQQAGQRALAGPLNPRQQPRRVRRDGPAQRRRSTRWARTRASTRRSSPSRSPQARYKALVRRGDDGAPLFNRAIAGAVSDRLDVQADHRAGRRSTSGADHAEQTVINDAGCIQIGDAASAATPATQAYGAVDLRSALQVSSDVYFYHLGERLFDRGGQVTADVGAAARASAARPASTCPASSRGADPRPQVARATLRDDCRERKCSARRNARAAPWLRRSDMRPFNLGDNVNLAVGQGDLQATPLQMAVAYSAIANGGRSCAPHLGLEVEDAPGRLVQRIERDAAAQGQDRPGRPRRRSWTGCALAASEPGGTSADVFAGWPHGRFPVFGKTGTAERPPKARPVLVRRLRARRQTAADRRRRHRRAGRLRRRRRRADRVPDARASGSTSGRRSSSGAERRPTR